MVFTKLPTLLHMPGPNENEVGYPKASRMWSGALTRSSPNLGVGATMPITELKPRKDSSAHITHHTDSLKIWVSHPKV